MTNQETFDTVVTALRKQEKPSVNEIGECMYRGPNGLKCAAGHLIPDDKYNPEFEGIAITEWDIGPILKEQGYDIRLVEELQDAHDSSSNYYGYLSKGYLSKLEERFKGIAEKFQLSYSQPVASQLSQVRSFTT